MARFGPVTGRTRLCILGTRGIPARYGGFETFAEELGARLAAAGVEVTVYCEAGEGAPLPQWRGMRLVHLAAPRLGPLTTLWFDLRCLLHAMRRFPLIYMLGYGSALFCLLPRLAGCELWINMDGLEWRRSKWSWPARLWLRAMEAMAGRVAHRLIADAAAIEAHLRACHGRLPPVSVIAYGAELVSRAELKPLARWGLSPDGYFLVVCRLEPENHVEEIIAGYLASDCPLPLVVVGDIRAPGAYTARLRALRDPRLRCIGTVYQHEALAALRFHARAYFHGHSVGGTNPSLLEALGCGNLVLAHDNPFNREVAADCAGYFAVAAHIPPLVAWVNALEPADRQARGARARARVSEHYHWDRVAAAYLSLLASPALEESAPQPT